MSVFLVRFILASSAFLLSVGLVAGVLLVFILVCVKYYTVLGYNRVVQVKKV